jgi:ankyrin repeat protein
MVHQAAKEGRADALELMGVLGFDLGIKGDCGETALHFAGYSGRFQAARVLVEAGVDLDACDTTYNAPPIGWVAYGSKFNNAPGCNHRKAAEILVAAGARIPPDTVGSADVNEALKRHLHG